MIYFIGDDEYDEDELDELPDSELLEIKMVAEKVFTDQKIIIGRGKLEYAKGGNGLTPQQFSRAKNIQNEAEGLIKCIDLIITERSE
jgi:hypothetical protein